MSRSIESSGDGAAREIALAENVQREPLHPIDEFQQFAALLKAGQTPEELSVRFGKSLRGIRQRLALGALAPEIIAAWRAGELRDDAAQAFTLSEDGKRQAEVYQRLKKQGNVYAHAIRSALGTDHNASVALGIVGADEYRAAGGTLTEDLFGSHHAVSDPKLAQKLLAEKIEATCSELEADGWSFAIERGTATNWHLWPKLTPKVGYTADERKRKTESAAIVLKYRDRDFDYLTDEERAENDAAEADGEAVEREALLRAFKPDLRKKSGCFVYVEHGELKIAYGVQKPATAKAEQKKAAKESGEAPAADEAPPTISNAVATDLSSTRTIVAAKALEAHPRLALSVLLAALERERVYGSGPLKIRTEGMRHLTPDNLADPLDFAERLNQLRDIDLEETLAALAIPVSRALDMRFYNAAAGPDDEADAIAAAIDPAEWQSLALERFDAQNYFSRIPIALISDALKEMLGGDYEPRGKKGELVEAAVAAQKRFGWLPQQLRHPSEINAQA